MSNNIECMVCKNADSSQASFHSVEEMMFGMSKSFRYMRCKECGLLQICYPPQDMGKYYSQNRYYSLQDNSLKGTQSKLGTYLRKQVTRSYVLKKSNPIYTFLTRLYPINYSTLAMFRELPELPHEGILDVGCGTGYILNRLYEIGFRDLLGVDLFIERDLLTSYGVKVMKGEIHDVSDQFKLIMFNHSFEHIWNQLTVLERTKVLLLPNGFCAIQMPVMNEAWKIYRENWCQIDAPRHFFIHTEKSFGILAERAGFEITRVLYNSTSSQFAASELYKIGIPLKKQTKSVVIREIGAKQLRVWEQQATEFNTTCKGDQAIFILRVKV